VVARLELSGKASVVDPTHRKERDGWGTRAFCWARESQGEEQAWLRELLGWAWGEVTLLSTDVVTGIVGLEVDGAEGAVHLQV
jgi:hypothetical protein